MVVPSSNVSKIYVDEKVKLTSSCDVHVKFVGINGFLFGFQLVIFICNCFWRAFYSVHVPGHWSVSEINIILDMLGPLDNVKRNVAYMYEIWRTKELNIPITKLPEILFSTQKYSMWLTLLDDEGFVSLGEITSSQLASVGIKRIFNLGGSYQNNKRLSRIYTDYTFCNAGFNSVIVSC